MSLVVVVAGVDDAFASFGIQLRVSVLELLPKILRVARIATSVSFTRVAGIADITSIPTSAGISTIKRFPICRWIASTDRIDDGRPPMQRPDTENDGDRECSLT